MISPGIQYSCGKVGNLPKVTMGTPGKGNGNPLQYSCLVNPMNRGAWLATVHGVTKSRTCLSNQTTSSLEKMAEPRFERRSV